MSSDVTLTKYRSKLLALAARYGVSNIRIFGSRAAGQTHKGSDFDFLVKMEPGRSLLDLIAFAQDAEDLLGCRVDVVAEGGISPYLEEKIFSEARPI